MESVLRNCSNDGVYLQIAVLVTDRMSSDPLGTAAQALSDSGITLYAVGETPLSLASLWVALSHDIHTGFCCCSGNRALDCLVGVGGGCSSPDLGQGGGQVACSASFNDWCEVTMKTPC